MKPTYTRRSMTNPEFVSHLMKQALAGPMVQVVIMAAIDNYTKGCIAAGPGCLGAAGEMISEESWLAACREIQQALDARRSPSSPYMIEELDTEHLDDGEFYVRLLGSNLQSLRDAAENAVKTLESSPQCNGITAMLRSGLQVTGGAYVDELIGE